MGDIEQAEKIWKKFYEQEMPFPNFLDKFLCAFSVIENDRIITIGGVRTIAEAILLTDKSLSTRMRVRALGEMFEAIQFVTARSGYNNINVFTHDGNWSKHLKKIGFNSERILSLQL